MRCRPNVLQEERLSELAVLILSCDRYKGLWPLFARRWHKFWPTCPHPVFILTNEETFTNGSIGSITVGPDVDWSSNLRIALKSIPQERVLLMIDDAPLDGRVPDATFSALLERFESLGMNYLNLKADPPPATRHGDALVAQIPAGALYRTALVPSIWKRSVLEQILVDGETAWHFEIRGSRRSDALGGFYVTRDKVFEWIHCVIKGKLDRRALRKLQASGDAELVNFPVMTRREYAMIRAKEVRHWLFKSLLPLEWQSRARDLGYSMLSRSRAMR